VTITTSLAVRSRWVRCWLVIRHPRHGGDGGRRVLRAREVTPHRHEVEHQRHQGQANGGSHRLEMYSSHVRRGDATLRSTVVAARVINCSFHSE